MWVTDTDCAMIDTTVVIFCIVVVPSMLKTIQDDLAIRLISIKCNVKMLPSSMEII